MIRMRLLGAGAAVLTFTVAACGTAQPQDSGGTESAAAKLLASATRAAESVVSSLGDSLGAAAEAKPVPPDPEAEVATPPVRRARPVPVPPGPGTEAPAASMAAVAEPDPVPVPVEPAPEPEEPVDAVPDPPIDPIVEDVNIYTSADADVLPPIPPVASGLRPWRRDANAEAGPSVEVTVASDGTVEKVQMFGKVRMTDAAVLSHVKAWQWEPATRGGEPVRYRLVLRDPVVAP